MNIFDIHSTIHEYFYNKHPNESNSCIIRLSDKITKSHNRRRSYIIEFPLIHNNDEILEKWLEYSISNILNDNLTIVSIDPLKINKSFDKINIFLAGININPEDFIRSLAFDIIELLNIHLIELYMDQHHPTIDIDDKEYNEIFDSVNINDIYNNNNYAYCIVHIPFTIVSDDTYNLKILGTIKTNSSAIDIIDDLRQCLDSNDTNEIFDYNKEDIFYNFGKHIEKPFDIIFNTDN